MQSSLAVSTYSPAPGPLPRMAQVRQHFDTTALSDIPAALGQAFASSAAQVLRPGMRVAITAGSRGIASYAEVMAACVTELLKRGTRPFVVAAMGSHGGATADGQRQVLAHYGITEQRVGCPVVTTTETVHIGQTAAGCAVHVTRAAYEADAILLLNRVKPHSILTGALGSGLMKMAAIGLGNHVGAAAIHRVGLAEHVLPAARIVLNKAPICFGIAVVENSLDQLWKIEAIAPEEIETSDQRLLAEARALLPNIPFDPIDILIVDTIGKNYSGTGMDPNVIGMHRRIGGPAQREIRRIVALDLSEESQGNANGIGMADITTARLAARVDWHATYTNALTADFLWGIKMPIACATAREAIMLAMQPFDAETVRAVRIANTAQLEDMWVSEALLAELGRYSSIEIVGELEEMKFDELLESRE